MTYRVNTRQVATVTAPLIEPVSLYEMRAHCRIDSDDSDNVLLMMIKAARMFVEKEYQLSLVQRTYRADVEGFADCYALPMPPLLSLTSVKYYTDDSPQVLTTLASNYYRADLGRGEIYLDADAGNLPTPYPRHDAVQLTYICGYAASTDSPQDLAGNVPYEIRAAIKLLAADLYENRETNTQLKMQELPTTKMLLAPWRQY